MEITNPSCPRCASLAFEGADSSRVKCMACGQGFDLAKAVPMVVADEPNERKLNGLDLFSGIGGISLALKSWVETVAYCESDRHAQAVLLQRMWSGDLDEAPIWDDVRTLRAENLDIPIDIIFGGFPCQDISSAGRGDGLEGKRSGLFFEVVRLVAETRPSFVFLENVPAIRTRGLREVVRAFTDLRYDCRWTCVSAADVGAPHLRKRWWLLAADPNGPAFRDIEQREAWRRNDVQAGGEAFARDDGSTERMAHAESVGLEPVRDDEHASLQRSHRPEEADHRGSEARDVADTMRAGLQSRHVAGEFGEAHATLAGSESRGAHAESRGRWAVEPDVGRVAHGVSLRVDRLRGLGNAVVPLAARVAFQRLAGMK